MGLVVVKKEEVLELRAEAIRQAIDLNSMMTLSADKVVEMCDLALDAFMTFEENDRLCEELRESEEDRRLLERRVEHLEEKVDDLEECVDIAEGTWGPN